MPHRRLLRVVDEFPTRLLVGILISLAVITTGYIWWSVERFEDFVHCQAEWSEELLYWQTANDDAAASERSLARFENQATEELIQQITDPDIDDEEALGNWFDTRDLIESRRIQLEQDREQNPLPEPPLEVCNGGAGEGDIAD